MQGLLTAKELQYFDQNAQLQLAIGAAQQYSLVASGKASEAQAKQAIANSVKLYYETQGIKVDNYVKQQTTDALIKTARNNCNTSYWISKDTKNAYDYNKDSRKLGVWKQSLDLFNPFSSVGRVGELMLRSK
jgi:electron transfer flavoprotein alpha subunit